MTNVTIEGHPIARMEFFDLLSWNTLMNAHFKSKGALMSKMRAYGAEKAQEVLSKMKLEFGEFMVGRALVIVKVLPPKQEISDIHNVCLKAVFDGFSEAGVWVDDEWAFVPLVIIMFAGIDEDVQWRVPARATKTKRGKLLRDADGAILLDEKGKKLREPSRQVKTKKAPMRRTIIEVHELGQLIINRQGQALPLGRNWL